MSVSDDRGTELVASFPVSLVEKPAVEAGLPESDEFDDVLLAIGTEHREWLNGLRGLHRLVQEPMLEKNGAILCELRQYEALETAHQERGFEDAGVVILEPIKRPNVRPNDTLTNAPQFARLLGSGDEPMLMTMTALALVALTDPPARKEPPSKVELAAITLRGRDLAGYDAAAWHASDAVQAKEPKQGSVVRYIARKTDKGWVVAFGRLDEKMGKFLIAYEATQGENPDVFVVKEVTPPKEDSGFYFSAAKAIDTSLKDFMEHFEGERRPYNVAVLPAEKRRLWVYLVPAPTKPNTWPLGGDFRYLISSDGTKVIQERQLHKAVIENEPPKDQNDQQVAGIHNHVLADTPEDTDVFHVLTRKPTVPEMITTERFVFVVDGDGSIKFQGYTEEVLKKK